MLSLGVVVGNAETLLSVIYLVTNKFANASAQLSCAVFILAQPLFTWFMYTLYIAQHNEVRSSAERFRKLAVGPLYTLGQWTKLLSASTTVYRRFEDCFGMREPFHLVTLENCFKT